MEVEQWQQKMPRKQQKKKSQAAARAEANFASGMHVAMSYPWARPPTPPARHNLGGWEHRQPEWECHCCGLRNYMTRPNCRQCAQSRSAAATLHPAGSPPPGRASQPPARASQRPTASAPPTAKPGGVQQPWGKPPNGDPVKLAEAAISAAQQAGAEEAVLLSLRATLEAKQQAATAKIPLAKRLQQATHRQTAAQATHAKAGEWLMAAQKAESEARAAMDKTRKELEEITAEVAATSVPVEPPAANCTAVLQALLEALSKAEAEGETARPAVVAAVAAAQAALIPPPPLAKPAPTAAATAPATATAANADTVMQTQAVAEKRAAELTAALEAETNPQRKQQRILETLNSHLAGLPVPEFPDTQKT